MDRREFLSGKFSGTSKPEGHLQATLGSFSGTLNRQQAYHLLRRLTFGARPGDAAKITGLTAKEAFDKIAGFEGDEIVSGYDKLSWLDIQEEDPLDGLPLDLRLDIEGRLHGRYRELVNWWINQMRDSGLPNHEKFTFFLSTIWCIEYTYDTNYLIPPPLLYRNNNTLRKNRLGSYRKIAEEMALDGAMLLYQSLNYSTKEAPNENFMRELLELFTMGIGLYSEGDIREGSRVLTGWRIAAYKYKAKPNGEFETYFSPQDHDIDSKNFMGETIESRDQVDNSEFQVRQDEVGGLLDIMFTKREFEIAYFVCEKIFRFFVYSSPKDVDVQIISELAEIFRSSGFSLRSVYEALFTSSFFYSVPVRGSQIKTPPDYLVGFQRALGHNSDKKELPSTNAMARLEMELYDPPNVGSWIGYRTWISTTTYPLRVDYSRKTLDMASKAELLELARQMPGSNNPDILIVNLLMHFLPVQVDDDRLGGFLQIMLNGIDKENWEAELSNSSDNAAGGIRNLISELITSPDFNLI